MERKEHINRSIDYYNTHSDLFINSSVNADMASLYEIFESYIEPGSYILDLGCGSGRDSKYFSRKGYKVLAVDPSEEICKKAETLLDTKVECVRAEELNYVDEFDAVWACASLLHVEKSLMRDTIEKIIGSIKDSGILYASWKYGDGERILDDGRHYSDYTEDSLQVLFNMPHVFIERIWTTIDVRNDNSTKWINIVVRKND